MIDAVPARRDRLHEIEDRPPRNQLDPYRWRPGRAPMVQRGIWENRRTAIKAEH